MSWTWPASSRPGTRSSRSAGRTADAIDALKISIWSQDTAPARLALAEAYLSARNPAAARTQVERALRLEPDLEEAQELLETLKHTGGP